MSTSLFYERITTEPIIMSIKDLLIFMHSGASFKWRLIKKCYSWHSNRAVGVDLYTMFLVGFSMVLRWIFNVGGPVWLGNSGLFVVLDWMDRFFRVIVLCDDVYGNYFLCHAECDCQVWDEQWWLVVKSDLNIFNIKNDNGLVVGN